MKKIILLLAMGVSIMACHKDVERNSNNMVLIKGRIDTAKKAAGAANYYFEERSLTDATKVVVFLGERYMVIDIESGSFSLQAPVGSATALIFVDASNQYIGNLTVSGLNILPLVNLADGENTVIDLSTLTLYENSVVPANNPIGKEILISAEDIEMLKEISAYFEAISKNLDADNDGVMDNFTGTELVINSTFNINCGKFGLNGTPAQRLDSSLIDINYGARISGWKSIVPEVINMSFTGPEGDPHDDIGSNGYNYNEECQCFNAFFSRYFTFPSGSSMLPFRKGIYTFSLDGKKLYTLAWSSISAKHFLLLAVPVIYTNEQGQITRVENEFMLPDGSPVDHNKFLTTLNIQFHNGSNVIYAEGAFFDMINILPDFTNVAITGAVNISDVTSITINYTDLVGNIYGIHWAKQD